ncbi:ultraviolet-B receptor UVR8 [Andrographis paniculata]|uniref:ultraviolet-B receptor UVR8 n=1 Tax=Andrographis paniculata TaxID=175694 RepID=UPI0021E8811E|nr:ultraviolet-B receptor UVR8 [Andrographis paniculata]
MNGNGGSPIKEPDDGVRQEIWSWGAGTDGQLATGRGSLQDEHTPQLIRSLSAFGRVTSLACGGAHAVALLSGGRVLAWGRGSSGQLGHGEMADCSQPTEVKALEGFEITCVSAGWNHSAFVSESGNLFTCGDGSFGQLGHGDYSSQCSPLEVSYFSSKPVNQVACGMRHSLVLLRENQVYGFGSGKRGQLGISSEKIKSSNYPQIALGITSLRITKVRANGEHSAALSDDGRLYTWGRGFGGASDECIPQCYDVAISLKDVALGWNHALLLTSEGQVFMLGGNRHGVLSEPQKTPQTSEASGRSTLVKMRVIPELMELKVLQIAAGAEHSAVVTDNDTIMTWGWGEHGQLGLGDTKDETSPKVVSLPHQFPDTNRRPISRVYCGSGFSFVLRTYGMHWAMARTLNYSRGFVLQRLKTRMLTSFRMIVELPVHLFAVSYRVLNRSHVTMRRLFS